MVIAWVWAVIKSRVNTHRFRSLIADTFRFTNEGFMMIKAV
jgi:hypothetical protein